MKISVIVPCYNAVGKLDSCIESLKHQTLAQNKFEVIFVDDCSSDDTYSFLVRECESQENFNVLQLKKNSGSPSRPRNYGIKHAKGEYIFFLDADDSLFEDTLEKFLEFANSNDTDIIRGYLITDNGSERKEFNRLSNDFNNKVYLDKVKILSSKHTLTPPQLIRRKFLLDSKVKWSEDIRMGEDALFALELFTKTQKIFYIDHPTYLYNQRVDPTRLSSTQTYGQRELENHLRVWQASEKILSEINLSFYASRLHIAIQSVVFALLRFYTHDIKKDTFSELSDLVSKNSEHIRFSAFNPQFFKIVMSIKENNFDELLNLIKPKLLIAGYDLKFILPAIPYLSKYYAIQVDEWTGHEIHNEDKSKELLKWADIIWCEWLLGNAVWYANHKLDHQKLIVRLHRFELTTKYIHQVDQSKIDKIMTVSMYFFEKTLEVMKIERSKVTVVPNYLITDKYLTSNNDEKYFNLGMIGILPSRKGYYEGLLLLSKLVKSDTRFKLHIYGKQPSDLPWIKNNVDEMNYFNKCDQIILENNLQNHVVIHGWCDIKQEIKNIGYILSLSKDEEIPESFHIAPAEAFCAGNIGLFTRWRGVEYIYPSEFIFSDIDELSKVILLTNKDHKLFDAMASRGKSYVEEKFSISEFCKHISLVIN